MLASIPRGVGCIHGSWTCWQRFFRHKSVASKVTGTAENVTRRMENLALEGSYNLPTVHDECVRFREASADMTPLQIIRGMNAFTNIGFCNMELLITFGERIGDLCEHASPKRITHLLTLLKRMNITHPSVVDPLMAAMKRHLHNYVGELPDVILNTAHLGYDDEELVELFRTQVMLNFDDLGHGTIRCAEALSRFRNKTCDVSERLKVEFMPKIKELTLKQQLYLLAAFSRYSQTTECNKLIQAISSNLSSTSLSQEAISKFLTLQKSIGVVVPKLLDVVMNEMEVRMNDSEYVNSAFPYHFYTLCKLSKANTRTLRALLQRVADVGIVPTSATAKSQLLFAISSLMCGKKSTTVDDNLTQGLINHLESCHRQLRFQHQEELYEALVLNSKYSDLPPGLAHFVSSKIPSSIPRMSREETDQQLAAIGGINYMFLEKSDGKREVLICVNESDVLSVVTRGASILARPCKLHNARALESLLLGQGWGDKTPYISYRTSAALDGKLVL